VRRGLLLLGGCGDFGRRRVDLNAGTLDLADKIGQFVCQPIQPITQYAKFIASIEREPFGKIAVAHPVQAGDQKVERFFDRGRMG